MVYKGGAKQGAIASMLEPTALLTSAALQLIWRVRHYTNENVVVPAKPSWFLSKVICLERDQVVRIFKRERGALASKAVGIDSS